MANCGTTSSKKGLLCSVGWGTTCSSTSRLSSYSFTLVSSLLAFLCFLSFSFFSLFSFFSFLGSGCFSSGKSVGKSVQPVVIHPPTALMLGYVFFIPPPGLGNVLVHRPHLYKILWNNALRVMLGLGRLDGNIGIVIVVVLGDDLLLFNLQ